MQIKFGKYKNWDIETIANEDIPYLEWLAKNTDPNDPKFGKNNQLMLAEIKKELDKRKFAAPPPKPIQKQVEKTIENALSQDPSVLLREIVNYLKITNMFLAKLVDKKDSLSPFEE